MKKKWEHVLDGVVITLVILWTLYLVTHSPSSVVDFIGIGNVYLFAFLVSLLGGLAFITFASVYPTIISFVIGGLDPFFLGITAALGLTISNIVFYYFGTKGKNLASTKSQEKFDKILRWLNRSPNWITPIIIWGYVGLTPFSNNVLTASCGLIDLPFKKILPPLIVGNLTFMWIFTYGTVKGVGLFALLT